MFARALFPRFSSAVRRQAAAMVVSRRSSSSSLTASSSLLTPATSSTSSSSSVASSFPLLWVARRGFKVSADELKVGMLVEHDGKKMTVLSYKAAMMGRRPTSLHVELRDTGTGKVYPVRYNTGDKVERVMLDTLEYTYLYTEGNIAYAMHPDTFEQIEFDASVLGTRRHYLAPDTKLSISFYQGQVFSVSGPDQVVVTVAETDAYSADKRVLNDDASKPAKLANGRVVNVPRFINAGDRIKIRINDESFVQRAE